MLAAAWKDTRGRVIGGQAATVSAARRHSGQAARPKRESAKPQPVSSPARQHGTSGEALGERANTHASQLTSNKRGKGSPGPRPAS